MSVSKRVRFEVFKRDKFTCQYCGKKAPDVVLHCDHIEPQSKGGTDDLTNLITACDTCNGGKGAIRLADDSAVTKQRDQLERLQERQEQIEMMLEWHRSLIDLDRQTIDKIADYWCELADWYGIKESGIRTLQKIVRKYGESAVLEAMRLSGDTYFRYEGEKRTPTIESGNLAFNKIGGVCRVRAASVEKPYLQDLLYTRAILRRRHEEGTLGWLNLQEASDLLELAFQNDADVEELKNLARRCHSWTRWKDSMCDYIAVIKGESA